MKTVLVILGSLFGLLFLAVVGITFYVLTFDPNENKELIASKFQESTGRTLTLGGDMDLTIYPWLGVTMNDVTISNAPGFSDTPLLHADHAAVRIKLLPLLSSSYEIDTIRLDGVAANLEVAGNGLNNWTFGEPAAASDEEVTEPPTPGGGLDNLILGGVDIRNTSVVYDNQLEATHYEISDLNLQIGELVYGQPLDITMTLDAASRTPTLSAEIAMNGTVLYDLDNERYDLNPLNMTAILRGPTVPTGSTEITLDTALVADMAADTLTLSQLELDALGSQLSSNFTITDMSSDAPALDASVNLRGDDLAVLFRVLEQNDLAQRVADLQSRYEVRTALTADMASGELSMPSLTANLLGATIDASLEAQRFNTDTPAAQGQLSASGPDLPLVIEVVGMLQGGSNGELTRYGRELARVPDKLFRVQTSFDADLEAGTLELPALDANLLGTTIAGRVSASKLDSETPAFNGEFNAQGPDLPLIMQIIGQLQGGQEAALNTYGRQLRSVQNRAFSLRTSFDADLEEGNINLPTLEGNMLGFVLNGQLSASDMQDNDGDIAGQFSLRGNNLREVLSAIGQQELGEVAESLALQATVSGSGNSFRISPLDLSLVVNGPQVGNQPQTLSFKADTNVNLDNDSLGMESFTVSGLGLNLDGNVQVSNFSGDMAYDGRIAVAEFNARQLLRQLNQPPLEMSDDTVMQRVGLTTDFSGTTNSLSVEDLDVRLDDTQLTGSLNMTDIAASAGSFSLNVDAIDADRYLAPTSEEAETSATTGEDDLPVETLRNLELQGDVNVGQLTISGLRMTDILVQLNATGGNVALAPIRANLYEGSFNGDIRLDASGETPAANVSVALATINLEPLLVDFMDATYLTGKGSVELNLAGNGMDIGAIKRSLNGGGSVALTDGVLNGINVGDVLARIETMIRNRSLAQLPQGGGQTPFDTFAATLAIQNGVVTTNDLVVTAPDWGLSGSGTLANLNDDSINFNLLAMMDEGTLTTDGTEYEVGGHALPIACTGSLSGPRCLPDVQTLFAAAVGNVVQQRLGEFLQDRLGTGTQQQDAAPTEGEATDDAQPEADEEPEQTPAEQLLNRALDRLRQ